MKKFGQFLICLVKPRKMAKYRNMHIALSILIFLLGLFIALGSQYMVSENFVKDEMARYEYKDTLKTLYVNPTTQEPDKVSGLLFRNMQTITFSSNSNVAVDEKNSAKLTNNVLVENFTYGDANIPFEAQIYFNTSFVSADINAANTSVLFNFYEAHKNNISTKESIFFYFGKVNVFYISSFQIPTLTAEAVEGVTNGVNVIDFIIDKGQYFEYTNDVNGTNVETALSYLRRIPYIFRNPSTAEVNSNTTHLTDNVDEVSFISNMLTICNKNYTNIKYVETVNNTVPYTKYSETYFETLGIYHKTMLDVYEHESGHYLDFTLVIDQNLNSNSEKNVTFKYFDYEGYMKQERDPNTTYVLVVLAFDRLFFIYDLSQDKDNGYTQFDYSSNSVFEKTSAGHYKYYLPKDETEITYNMYGDVDTTKWTLESGKDQYSEINGVEYFAHNRHNKDFYYAVYTSHSRSYLYSDLVGSEVNDSTFKNTVYIDKMLQSIVNQMVKINASNYELLYAILAFLAVFLFPIVLVLIVWAMSRKLFMKRIRQYYAIAALCYGATSLISFIVGFFLPFDKYALFLMFFQAWWFIFTTYRINTDPKYNNDNPDEPNEDNENKSQNLEFKKVKDADQIKASKIG